MGEKKEKKIIQAETGETTKGDPKPLEDHVRAFININTKGNAKGGLFFRNPLIEHIEKVEKEGVDEVVGVVYDGTYNLELITQPIKDLDKLNIVEGVVPKND